jgi:Neurotransmitter-gated ion-channel ligand binding domain
MYTNYIFSGNKVLKNFWVKVFNEWRSLGLFPVDFFEWVPICIYFSQKLELVNVTVNGKIMNKNSRFENVSQLSTTCSTHFIWTNAAVISEVNVYSDSDGILANVVRYPQYPGNILAWNTSLWKYSRILEPYVRILQVSKRMVLGQMTTELAGQFFFVSVKMDFTLALDKCYKLGNGTLAQFRSKAQMIDVWSEAKGIMSLNDEYMWSTYVRSKVNGSQFVHKKTNEPIPAELWKTGQPNNMAQSCVVYNDEGYDDEYCGTSHPFACQLEDWPQFRLRGLCSESSFDTVYFPFTLLGELVWIGSSPRGNTFIRFNQQSYRWESRVGGSDIWGYSQIGYESLLLGTNIWTIFNDRQCGAGLSYEKNLSLTFCSDDFFNCDDGGCLLLDYWCDQNFEPDSSQNTTKIMSCLDGSDEEFCHSIETRPGYLNQVAPTRHPKTVVEVYASIMQILDISPKDSKIRLKFNISLEWVDPRLNIHGLWEDGPYNVLTPMEFNYVWVPDFNYTNILQKDLEVHQPAVIYVYKTKNCNWTVPDLTSLHNYQVYSGKDIKFHWSYKLRCGMCKL